MLKISRTSSEKKSKKQKEIKNIFENKFQKQNEKIFQNSFKYIPKNNSKNNTIISNGILLAPMAGFTDAAFRTLALRHGFGLTLTEMVSSDALLFDNPLTKNLLQTTPEEKILYPQIFGNDEKKIGKCANMLEDEYDAKIIDINMGCPARKIIQENSGSELLKYPDKIKKIVEATVSTTNIPITCKIRLGISEKNINVINTVKTIESAGANAITIHARTQKQGYEGTADWNWIKTVKENKDITIPIIANGDIKDTKDIEFVKKNIGADGVMIGRAARSDPFLLEKDKEKKQNITPTKEYLEIIEKYDIEVPFIMIKNHIVSFTKGSNLGPKIRETLTRAKTIEELNKILKNHPEI